MAAKFFGGPDGLAAWASNNREFAMKPPVLALQLRRMGDLILSFPLFMDLQRRFAGHPLRIVAQPAFFKPLIQFAPSAVYFPPQHLPTLVKDEYAAVVNLSGPGAAAEYLGKARALIKLGALQDEDSLRVNGFWHLYRESLTGNNRHNTMHWADLHRLDLTGLPMPAIARHTPRGAGTGRVGLFVGASEMAKRPGGEFWADLATRLAARGLAPVLLGGPQDSALGMEIMRMGAAAANLCGQTDIAQLSGIIRSLDLLITPDTGPMHLADWLGAPVLNLSMGPVHAAETGPLSPGQYILQANMSCAGCWSCRRPRLYCRAAFMAPAVLKIALAIIDGKKAEAPSGFSLLCTARDAHRLHILTGGPTNMSSALDHFWRAAFLHFSGLVKSDSPMRAAGEALNRAGAPIVRHMRQTLAAMLMAFAHSARRGETLPDAFWRKTPWHSRLFAGHAHMEIQNSGNAGRAAVLERIGIIQAALTH